MEFRDLKQQYLLCKDEIDDAVQKVLLEADFINGKQVNQLRTKLADYVGTKFCVTCANGTDALQLALLTWKVGEGDAVFVPDFTFFSSGEVVSAVGAVPVFVDIEEETYNISAESLKKAVQYVLKNTNLIPRVVIAVDLFGQPADFAQIRKVADKYDLLILEDAAQGFGGKIGEERACSFGDIATTSFFPAKPLGCYGDGGAVFTDNEEWAELVSSYCVHGKGKDKYDNIRIGMNSRLDTLQAAILLEKLKIFDVEIRKCNIVAEEYSSLLKNMVKVPIIKNGMYSSWAQYTICFRNKKERENAIKVLKENGIPAAVYYRKPLHLQKAFYASVIKELEYRNTQLICESCLSLPMHAYLDREDIHFVVNTLQKI